MRTSLTISFFAFLGVGIAASDAQTPSEPQEEKWWLNDPIVGLAETDGQMIGKVMIVPDANGGIWRMDTETGMVSRCWHPTSDRQLKDAGPLLAWETTENKQMWAPRCTAWSEF